MQHLQQRVPPTAPRTGKTAHYLAAQRVAEELARIADWRGDSCTWLISGYNRTTALVTETVQQISPGHLYQGTAGIALFLTELLAIESDSDVARVAAGALRHSVEYARALPQNAFGFHAGRVGVAYSLARFARVTGDDRFMVDACDVLTPLFGNERTDAALDVIGGGAGAIPALLLLSDWTREGAIEQCAIRLGERLIDAAIRMPVGWAWTGLPGAAQHLNGYAHGAAGYAHAFAELFARTGSPVFEHAALQAFEFLDTTFDARRANWPDYRNSELNDALQYGRYDARGAFVSPKSAKPYTRHFMSGWCHGAPGIALALLRGSSMLTNAGWLRDRARAALETTRHAVETDYSNASTCHGVFGNIETLITAAEVLDEPVWRQIAETAATTFISIHGDGPHWPSGTLGGNTDPSLLLGDAGAGYQLLRLSNPSVPSFLALTAAIPTKRAATSREGLTTICVLSDLTRRHIDEYFSRSTQVFARLTELSLVQTTLPTFTSPGEALRFLQQVPERESPTLCKILRDAFALDFARFRSVCDYVDYGAPYLELLRRKPWSELSLERATFEFSHGVRIVDCEYDWDEWLRVGEARNLPDRVEAGVHYVLRRDETEIRTQRLAPLSHLVLTCAAESWVMEDFHRRVLECVAVDASESDAIRWREIVERQVKAAYTGGLIREVVGAMADE